MPNRRTLASALSLLCACVLPLTCAAADKASEVVAKVAGSDFTRAQLETWLNTLEPDVRRQVESNHAALIKLLREHLGAMEVLADARANGWDKRPEIQARAIAAAQQVILSSYLASLSQPPAAYPTDAEVQSFYDQNKDRFVAPRAWHLAQIYIALEPGAKPAVAAAAENKAQDLVRKAKAAGADFAALARANSDEKASAGNGGDVGFVPDNKLLPALRKVVAGLDKGAVSDAVRAPDGFHILKLIDTRPASIQPLKDVDGEIRNALRQARQQALAKAYLDKLEAANPITINEIALGGGEAPAKTDKPANQ